MDEASKRLFSPADPETLFTDLSEIGHGNFGAVYHAKYKNNGEVVAIKKMSFAGKNRDEKFDDIKKEVQFIRQLRHENCVRYISAHLNNNTAWLVMEYCLGSASDIIEVLKAPLKEVEIASIIHGALRGLAYLHSMNFIHRDLKAGNILLTESGCIKLGDFGSASLASPANSFIGTPYWMSPELITAMEDGVYDGKTDMWSLGITSLELAETKPPLFHMNAMSALYHIPQDPPPRLQQPDRWSRDFCQFVERCLQTAPAERMSSEAGLGHPFMTRDRPASTVLDLIARSVRAVQSSNTAQNFRRGRKILIGAGGPGGPEIELDSDSLASEDLQLQESEENGSLGSASAVAAVVAGSPAGGSPTATHQRGASGVSTGAAAAAVAAPQSAYQQPGGQQQASLYHPPTPSSSATSLPAMAAAASASANPAASSPALSTLAEQQQQQQQPISTVGGVSPYQISHPGGPRGQPAFPTIKSSHIVHRERREHLQDATAREQMSNYKQLRRKHQKIVKQREAANRAEENSIKQQLDRVYTSQRDGFQKALDKLAEQTGQSRDRLSKELASEEEKLRRTLESELKARMKALRKELDKDQRLSKPDRLAQSDSTEKKDLYDLETQMRACKRRGLLTMLQFEREAAEHDIALRSQQKDMQNALLMEHHERIKKMEEEQLSALHRLKIDQMREQHNMERTNQDEFFRKQTDDLNRRQQVESKNLPKNLKLRIQSVRKQYTDTVKIQESQFKYLEKQVSQSQRPKDEQREELRRIRTDKETKLTSLQEQYNWSIIDLKQKVTDNTKTNHQQELVECKRRQEEEKELLAAYQSKVQMSLLQAQEKERQLLQIKIETRYACLNRSVSAAVLTDLSVFL
uniref:non-specific serine/threonine protein kinase n=2 Tax=Macrostomum lignano TaxID=282301 RepID=A0A1I8IMJ4_9PLAT